MWMFYCWIIKPEWKEGKKELKCSFRGLIAPFSIHAINKPANRTVKCSDPLQHDNSHFDWMN